MDQSPLESETTSTACAKFLVAGEYSVLLEGPALAIPLKNLQLRYGESPERLSDSPDAKPDIFLNGQKITSIERFDKVMDLRRTLSAAPLPSKIFIETEIPIGKGLGSSAALCVAMARHLNPETSAVEIADLALEGEKLFHGSPSGVDPYCVSLGIPIAYTREPRSYKPLSVAALSESELVFFLRDSGNEHSTRSMVQSLIGREDLLHELASYSQKMLYALESDAERVPFLMKEIHQKLHTLGASSPQIESNIAELISMGALGAKLTGSGRGGFVLSAFLRTDFAKLPSSAQATGLLWDPSCAPV